MAAEKPISMMVIYHIKTEHETAFLELLKGHWPTLSRLELVTSEPAQIFRGAGKKGGLMYVEMFSWRDSGSSEVAHQTPEIMQIWEPMGPMLENLQLINIEPVKF